MKILYLSPIDWGYIKQRPQHLALQLSRNHEVVYFIPQSVTRYLRKWVKKWKSRDASPFIGRRVNERLFLYQPFVLPQGSVATLARMNRSLSRVLLKLFIKRRKLEDFAVWMNHPHQVNYISLFVGKHIFYDCMDSWSEFNLGREKELIEKEESYILSKADVVFVSSRLLFERMEERCQRVYLVPNAAEVEHFAQAVNTSLPMPSDLKNLKGPLIGYVGTVAEWHDMSLIRFIAKAKSDYNYVFVGPIGENADISECKGISNIHFLGGKSYETLPSYLQHFDVCILPFRTGDFAASIDPVKAYEYLAAGKPVVTTDMPELRKFGQSVKIAKDQRHFAELLSLCVEEIKSGKHDPRVVSRTVKDHSWEIRSREIENILNGFMEKIKKPL